MMDELETKLLKLIEENNFSCSYNDIRKKLGIQRQHKENELNELLFKLELDGIIYKDENDLYLKQPSNFFVVEILQSKKGIMYFIKNDDRYYLNNKDLYGIQEFDKVLVSIENNNVNLIKIIKKEFPTLAAYVKVVNGKKFIYPINTCFKDPIVISQRETKKLVNGDIIQVNLTKVKYNGKYLGDYIKTIGHQNEPNIDEKIIAISCGFEPDFSDEAKKEAENIPNEVRDCDIVGRYDFRNLNVFTIDGIDAKDLDDGISIKKTNDGYILGVHIMHVSNYVKPYMKIFKEALERSTSVYFPGGCFPMLPRKLSNGICSLNPREDRLTRSVIIKLDNEGNVLSYKIVKSVVNSKMRMNYDDVEKVITGKEYPEEYKDFVNDLNILEELSKKLDQKRKENGYLSFPENEVDFNINEGKATGAKGKIRLESENIIENCMVLANHLVASYFPILYRNHEYPDEVKVKQTIEYLKSLGYTFEKINQKQTRHLLQSVLEQLKDKEEFFILAKKILISIKRAYYSITNKGHFGLGLEFYCHFTSPIRRIMDLLTNTTLDMLEDPNITKEQWDKYYEFLSDMAEYASKKERLADKAEYYGDKNRIIEVLQEKMDETFTQYIDAITPRYIIVRSKDLMDGIIYFDDIDDNVYYEPEYNCLKSIVDGKLYKVGHKVEVKVKDACKDNFTIYYSLVKNITSEETVTRKKKIN
jgi:ribonuclease R